MSSSDGNVMWHFLISCNFYDKALLNVGADGAVGYKGGGKEHEKDAHKHPVPWAKIEHTQTQ